MLKLLNRIGVRNLRAKKDIIRRDRIKQNRDNQICGIKDPNCLNWVYHIFWLASSDYGGDVGNPPPVSDTGCNIMWRERRRIKMHGYSYHEIEVMLWR
jgi:hypothetical protein